MADKIVTYKARETPSDANSDVLLNHKLHIAEQSRSGNDITWKINTLKFNAPAGGNWTDDSPSPSSWVVTHADPDNPVASDFTSPPNMSGTADADSAGGEDLTYSFTLGSCTVSEGQMYGGDVTCAAYRYATTSETITEEDEDEPTEIDSEDDPI